MNCMTQTLQAPSRFCVNFICGGPKERKITSVTDFGCGTGVYVKMISEAGMDARGFDGNPSTNELDMSGGLCTGPVNLTEEGALSSWWTATDAAMSMEVAEHIPAQFEANFVNNLGTLSLSLKHKVTET